MFLKKSENLPWIVVLMCCSSALIIAYSAEYFFQILPCHLCLYHRYAYYTAAGSAILTILSPFPWKKIFSWVILGACLGGLGISIYHISIENHWVHLPESCKPPPLIGHSLEEIKQEIMHHHVVPCDQPGWSFLGISFTIYSGLLFLGLLGLTAASIFVQSKILKGENSAQ